MSQQIIQDGGHTYIVTYDDATGKEICRAANDPGPPVRPVPRTKLGYRNLFTLAERIAIDNYQTNANLTSDQKATLTSLHYDFQLAEDIDLSDPQLIAGTQLLEQYGLIAQGRAAQVLANQPAPA